MFMQVYDLPKYWKRDILDGLLWLGTFIAVILLDIDSGLYVGIALNVCLLCYRGLRFKV